MPDVATTTGHMAGLFALDEVGSPVPLTGVSVEGTITGLCGRISVAHRYRNTESTPIEAVYLFPLDEGAAVCGFEAIVDGTVIVGEVQERERAFVNYDDAIERGDGAFLLDEERPDVFRASIGNLPPGKEVLVRITYVTELAVDDGRCRFTLPTTIAPKYAPAEDQRGVGRPEAEAVNPPVAWQVPYGLHLSLRVQMPGGLTSISSPSHPVALSLEDGAAIVTLAMQEAALDRDFILTADAAVLRTPQVWVDAHGDDGDAVALAVALAPDLPDTSSASEIVFLVDRSGSMTGQSIDEVRNALQLCLRAMTADCCFNIVGFGSAYEALFPESRAYDQASLEAATRHVDGIRATLGGTEILPALQFVLGQPSRPGLPRQVVVLTDGEVTNTDAVIELAKQHRHTARVFTFGIGASASQHLVKGLARAGGGTAEFIYPGERIEGTVMRQVARLLSPALTDVRIEWVGGTVTPAPAAAPQIFRNQRLLVYGQVTGAMPTEMRLTANGPSGPLEWHVPIAAESRQAIPSSGTAQVGAIATLAARARIRELEESESWLASRGSQQRERRQSAVRQRIIDLSVRYSLLSRETSFVAIEPRATPLLGDMQLRRVPVALAHGWGGRESAPPMARRRVIGSAAFDQVSPASMENWDTSFEDRGDASVAYCRVTPRELVAEPAERRAIQRKGTEGVRERLKRVFTGAAGPAAPVPAPHRHQVASRMPILSARVPLAPPLRPTGLDALVKLQSAAGAWDLDDALARVIGHSVDDLRLAIPDGTVAPEALARAWATVVAIAWLERHAPAQVGEWRVLALKARRWLDAEFAGTPRDAATWLAAARAWLATPIPF